MRQSRSWLEANKRKEMKPAKIFHYCTLKEYNFGVNYIIKVNIRLNSVAKMVFSKLQQSTLSSESTYLEEFREVFILKCEPT